VKAKWGLGTSRSARRTPASHPAIRVFGRKGTETRKRVFPAGGRKFAFWKGRVQGGYQEREVVERKGLVEVEVLGGSAEGRRVEVMIGAEKGREVCFYLAQGRSVCRFVYGELLCGDSRFLLTF
jgi:hypothetical protein